MYLGQVEGGQVFSYVDEPKKLFVKVCDMDIYLRRPPVDPASTELALEIGGDGKLVRCSHNIKVNLRSLSDATATK